METQEIVSRRQLLSALGTSWVAGVAGCGRLDDFSSPEITDYSGAPTQQAGELVVSMQAEDDEGLRSLAAGINEHMAETSVDGAQSATLSDQKITIQDTDTLTPFEQNTVTYRAEDTAGNVAQQQDETYVRKYDKMEDTRLNISARYIPFAGDGLGRCLDAVDLEPTVGDYGTAPPDPVPAEVTSQHIDQMTGHGINRMTFVFNGKPRNYGYINELLKTDNINQIRVEPSYSVLSFWNNEERNWKEDVLPEHLGFLKEHLMSRDNAARHEGRPMLHTWNIINLANDDTYREKINDEFGGFKPFVNDIRDHLRVGGRDPFLVAGTDSVDNYLYLEEDVNELVTEFDAVCPWIAADLDSSKQTMWGEAMVDTELVFSEQAKFAGRNNMEFIPTIYPGFNDKENTCHDNPGRHLPRSLDKFKQLLELAEQYSSSGKINIATWNDWVEGTQIEPGMYRETEYGTDYLEIVEKFQRSGGG